MNRIFGYSRISTPKQNIDRQVRNILALYPDAKIIREVFTGTKFQGRKEFDNLLIEYIQEIPLSLILFPECPEMQKKDF